MSEDQTGESSDGPPKSRKVGGWADEKGRRKRDTVEEDERLRVTDGPEDGDDDEDLPVIPDLEAVQEEDLTTQIAAPPTLAINRLASYKQLDTNLQRQDFTLGGDIDLQLLAKVLSPKEEIIEEDSVWEYDKVFAALSGDIQRVWERRDRENTAEQPQDKTSPDPS